MKEFMKEYHPAIIGYLNGFDRLVFRGTLRALSVTAGMMDYLYRMGVLLKEFGSYVENTSARLKEASLEAAHELNRPIHYLTSPQTNKESLAKEIARRDRIKDGLICVLTSVEPCKSYEISRNREMKKLVLRPRIRKCLFLYHYWMDPQFGFMHGRIQSWFPFSIQVCMNGREWLAGKMDRAGIQYHRSENCFPWIEDIAKARSVMARMTELHWPSILKAFARKLNPVHEVIFDRYRIDYYWSVHQSEWATDVMFRSSRSLNQIYPALVRGAISSLNSRDVMRFLGKKLNGNFKGEVVSDYRQRPEGIRVKHRVKANSVKAYNKQGSVFRVETTINHTRDFKVYRRPEGNKEAKPSWQRMRKGIADLHRRAQLSQAANERYLDALAAIHSDFPLREVIGPVCKPVRWKRHRIRALRPWQNPDQTILQLISDGGFILNGFRNRDLAEKLNPSPLSKAARKKLAARVTRQIRMLRAHRIVSKVNGAHLYRVNKKGRKIITAILEYQHLTIQQLNKITA